MIKLYTDGSVKDGKGGYGYVLLIEGMTITAKFQDKSKDINHLELLAVVEGLQVIQGNKQITVYTDSHYVLTCSKIKFYCGRKKKAKLRSKLTRLMEIHHIDFIIAPKNCCLHKQAHDLAREATNYQGNS